MLYEVLYLLLYSSGACVRFLDVSNREYVMVDHHVGAMPGQE